MKGAITKEIAAARLKAADNILLLTHIRPDGDTVGSAAALCQGLRDMGKTAYLLPNGGLTATYAPYAQPYTAPADFTPDFVAAVDIATLNLLPENARCYENRIDLTIDHHGSQEYFAHETWVDGDTAACGELVYELLADLTPLTPAIALPLYVAVSTDTGCFVYANTTAHTHRVAAALMDSGIDVKDVNRTLFRLKSRTRLAMESRMAADMELYDEGRLVIMTIPLALRQELHATEADIEELSALAGQVEGTDCGITLRELKKGVIKLSVRTSPRVDACALCQKLGGGGHKGAAGATVEGTMDSVKQAALAAYREIV